MPVNKISETYGVSPQISLDDLSELQALGYSGVICNRPDDEVGPDIASNVMAAEAAKRGLSFCYNPVSHGGMTEENITTQAQALAGAKGPILGYCRSGQRSAICWAIATAEHETPDDVIKAVASAGYNLEGLRPHLEAVHKG